jgi:long-subunit fatty acid transport protein
LIPNLSNAGGLDLSTAYGARIASMGGGHITLGTDAMAPFYNPATMSAVQQFAFTANFFPLVYQNEAPVGADNASKKSKTGLAPLFYLGSVYRVHERIHLGLAVYPTALQGQTFTGVDYNDALTDKELHVRLVRIEIAPSISFEILPQFSAGLSYRIGYTQYEKKAGAFLAPEQGGSYSDMTVNSWDAKGLKLGIHLEDYHGFSFGAAYRLQQKLKLTGDSTIESALGENTLPAEQHVTIPMRLELGTSYRFYNDQLTAALSYAFTQNSKIKLDDTRVTGIDNSLTQQPLNYSDGHTFSLGMDYRQEFAANRHYRVGAGYTYDRRVTNKRYPNPTLPAPASYHGINFGGGYGWNIHSLGLSVNMGRYSYTATDLGGDLIPQTTFEGTYKSGSIGAILEYQIQF